MSRHVLLTGAAGFVGSHCLEHLLKETDWQITCLVSFRHKGCPLRLDFDAFDSRRVRVIHHDLSCPLSRRMQEHIGKADIVINMASESHVDRSIVDPTSFIQNNVSLAITMLDYARWAEPDIFLQISTDEVYGPAAPGTLHAEWSPLLPSNPYSASKAAQEAIAFSYWRTYGVPVVITNTMNNFGERQDVEKFIPLVISRVAKQETVQIHGAADGTVGSRFYLHARNHADALLFLIQRGAVSRYPQSDRPDRWNVVGELEVDNLSLARRIAAIMGLPLHHELLDFHSSRLGHDLRYALDGSKLAAAGWRPPVPFAESLERTVLWSLEHDEWLAAA